MGSLLTMEHIHLHPLHSVIQRSFSISRHIDFFLWMQESVVEYLPHDVLIAAWGDFDSGHLQYDIASNVPGVRTQTIASHDASIDSLMMQLHKKWVENDNKWFVINNFDVMGVDGLVEDSVLSKLTDIQSVLVYGITDSRSRDDTLYVFFNRLESYQIKHSVMGMLMPHVDSALRKIECLIHPEMIRPNNRRAMDKVDDVDLGFSEREQEILHWIGTGKTNYEIGKILEISPNTVKNHVKRIFGKLEVSSRAQAIAKYNDKNHPLGK